MTKILVTGANGQLGSEIRAISSMFDGFEFIFTDIEELDITLSPKIDPFFSLHSDIRYIINCAAYTQVDKAESETDKAFLINHLAVKNLVLAAVKSNSKLIHISTDYVFDGISNIPLNEQDEVNPVSVYGKSKLAGEQVIINSEASYMIVRTSWLYSSFGHNFVKTISRLSAEKDVLRVVFDQVGSPTYAADLAMAICNIISKTENHQVAFTQGIYHYANQGVCSWYDLAVEIVKALNRKCTIIPIQSDEYPSPVKRPHYSVLNTRKIKSVYDIQIPHWRESLQRCIAFLTM